MNVGELLLSDIDPVPEGCAAGEWPDDFAEGSELDSVSCSCCDAEAGRKSKIYNMRTYILLTVMRKKKVQL